MKKTWISILEFCGIKASDDASSKIQLQEEHLDTIKSTLEESKGFKEKHDAAVADLATAKADLETAQTELAAANTAKEAAETQLTELKTQLDTANARVAELEEAAGADPTNAGGKDDDKETEDTPYVNKDAAHNKFIEEQRAKLRV